MADLAEWQRLLRSAAHVLNSRPGLAFQLAANEPPGSSLVAAALHRRASGRETRKWLRWLNRPAGSSTTHVALPCWGAAVHLLQFCESDSSLLTLSSVEMGSLEVRFALEVWNVATGARLQQWFVDGETSGQFHLSENGTRLAFVSGRKVQVFESKSGIEQATFELSPRGLTWRRRRASRPQREPILRVRLASRASVIAVSTPEGRVHVFDASADKPLMSVSGTLIGGPDSHYLRESGLSPDGTLLLGRDADGRLAVWKVPSSQRVPLPAVEAECAALSPDARRLLVIPRKGGETTLLDVETGEVRARLRTERGRHRTCAFSAYGKYVAAAGDDGVLTLFDADHGAVISTTAVHEDSVRNLVAASLGTRIASASLDATVTIFEPSAEPELRRLRNPTGGSQIALSPTGNLLALAGRSLRGVLVVDVDATPQTEGLDGRPAWSLGVAGDGSVWALGDRNGFLARKRVDPSDPLVAWRGHSDVITGVDVSSDGRRIVSSSADGTLKIWRSEDGRELATAGVATSEGLWRAQFTPDGTRVLASSRSGLLHVWEARRLREIDTLGPLDAWSMSRDGLRILSSYSPWGSTSISLTLWNLSPASRLAEISGFRSPLIHHAFTSRGERIVVAEADGGVSLWNGLNGERLGELLTPVPRRIVLVGGSENGRWIFAASDAGHLTIWDGATGEVMADRRVHRGSVSAASFGPHDELLATASNDGSLWIGSPRLLTEAEWLLDSSVKLLRWFPSGSELLVASDSHPPLHLHLEAGASRPSPLAESDP
jgi:WD40 repeat protein